MGLLGRGKDENTTNSTVAGEGEDKKVSPEQGENGKSTQWEDKVNVKGEQTNKDKEVVEAVKGMGKGKVDNDGDAPAPIPVPVKVKVEENLEEDKVRDVASSKEEDTGAGGQQKGYNGTKVEKEGLVNESEETGELRKYR